MPVTRKKAASPTRLADDTELSVPLRNLVAIVFAVASVTWGYFTLVEQINQLQSDVVLLQLEQRSNSEFRIKWPRGEMGSLPDDARQDMKLENMEGKISDLAHMDSEFEVVRMRVAALEDFASRPSRSTAHIQRVEVQLQYLTTELERLRNKK
jgi:hypothetical protein